MVDEKMVKEAMRIVKELPAGSTVRIDNDSWEALLPGWNKAPWMEDDADVDSETEEKHWKDHSIEGKCCHEPPNVTLLPALLRLRGLREDFI